VTPNDSLLLGAALVELLAGGAVSVALLPSSAIAALPREPLPKLRILLAGGEACSPKL
jgi:acyl-coenzyme A synthetase/AMP-(fatty) acid ligase